MSPGKRDLIFLSGFEPILTTHGHGGPAVQYLVTDEARRDGAYPELNTAGPMTQTGWFQTEISKENVGLWMADKDQPDSWSWLSHRGGAGTEFVQTFHHNYDDLGGAHTADSPAITDEQIHFAAGTSINGGHDLEVFVDGITAGTSNNVTNSRRNIDRIGMGHLSDSTPSNTGDGDSRWWDTRIYLAQLSPTLIRQMFEPDTRYDLYEEYGQKTYFDQLLKVPKPPVVLAMPFIRTNVSAAVPKWPWKMNEESEQAKDLHLWWPASPHTPGTLLDMSPLEPGEGTFHRHDATLDQTAFLDPHKLGGMGVRTPDTFDRAFDSGSLNEWDGHDPMTLFGWFQSNALTARNIGFWIANGNSGNQNGNIYLSHEGQTAGDPFRFFVGGFNTTPALSVSQGFSDTNPHLLVGAIPNADLSILYVDGLEADRSTQGRFARFQVNRVGMGAIQGASQLATGDGTSWDGRLYLRTVPPEEIARMHSNEFRYDLYEEYGRRTYFDMGGQRSPQTGSEIFQPMMTIVNQ
jgi:hypothetical protein